MISFILCRVCNIVNRETCIIWLTLSLQATPHTLEPIDLLTVEAYQVRMRQENQMTYFKNVSSKVALRLNDPSFQDIQRDYMIHCCNPFQCGLSKKTRCRDVMRSGVAPSLHGIFQPEDTLREFPSPIVIFHYTRSLERFELQYSVNKDSSSKDASAKGQNVGLYMDQSVGMWEIFPIFASSSYLRN